MKCMLLYKICINFHPNINLINFDMWHKSHCRNYNSCLINNCRLSMPNNLKLYWNTHNNYYYILNIHLIHSKAYRLHNLNIADYHLLSMLSNQYDINYNLPSPNKSLTNIVSRKCLNKLCNLSIKPNNIKVV